MLAPPWDPSGESKWGVQVGGPSWAVRVVDTDEAEAVSGETGAVDRAISGPQRIRNHRGIELAPPDAVKGSGQIARHSVKESVSSQVQV